MAAVTSPSDNFYLTSSATHSLFQVGDLIVVNKADLLSKEQTPLLKDIVHALAPRAEILTCSYGDIPLTKALGKQT